MTTSSIAIQPDVVLLDMIVPDVDELIVEPHLQRSTIPGDPVTLAGDRKRPRASRRVLAVSTGVSFNEVAQ